MNNPSRAEKASPLANFKWWERGVIYQVYPRSFQDSDGDGVGDLAGIRSELDYLHGSASTRSGSRRSIRRRWPISATTSPTTPTSIRCSARCGFRRAGREAHGRGLKVLLDFVPNHTSDQHPWFLESRSSRDSAKRDWYIWRDPAPDGGPPNNWLSPFGGGAWEWDEATGQYYYHAFLKEQPDLNWRNPEVRQAMLSVLRFWLDRGVDGFRLDVMRHLIKDEQFRDNPPNPDWRARHVARPRAAHAPTPPTSPEVHEVVGECARSSMNTTIAC